MEFELIKLGLRLRWLGDGTDRLLWHDLMVIVCECFSWSTADYLLASAVDSLHVLNWQNGGGKGAKPKLVPRPGYTDTVSSQDDGNPFNDNESGVFRGEMTPIPELNSWLGWDKPLEDSIFEAYSAGGTTYKKVAELFNVSPSTVGRIVRSRR